MVRCFSCGVMCRVAEGEARLGTLQAEVQAKVQVVLSHLDGLAKREARHAQRRGKHQFDGAPASAASQGEVVLSRPMHMQVGLHVSAACLASRWPRASLYKRATCKVVQALLCNLDVSASAECMALQRVSPPPPSRYMPHAYVCAMCMPQSVLVGCCPLTCSQCCPQAS